VSLSSTGIANPVARPADSTVYTVVVSNNFCKDSARVAVHVISAPVANAGPDKAMVEGQSIQLNGMVNGGNVEITWSPVVDINDIHSLHPTVSPLTNRSYSLTATSRLGCGTSTDSTHVRVYKKVIIPNAFSPNGDGINDYWNIPALAAYDNYKLLIINRYGQKVFESFNYTEPWNGFFNGKALPTGTYYYLLDLKLGLPILNGYVVILR
jgi:gliding motility-associated-like protein